MNAQESDDGFTPRPPAWDGSDLQVIVDHAASCLRQAAEGRQPAFNLSFAMLTLANRRGVISEAQRDKLARALFLFGAVAERVLPSDIDRSRITPGLEAAFLQVCCWSMTPEDRKAMDYAELLDVDAHARLLRNAAHDSCLLSDIRERERERSRAEAMAEFMFSPVDGSAH